MRLSEVFKLVWLNLSQNKSKAILTSVGIIVGTATIMLVIAIGTGGREEVAEQFKNLNAGSIDIEYDSSSSEEDSSGFGGFGGFVGGSSGGRRHAIRRRYAIWWRNALRRWYGRRHGWRTGQKYGDSFHG